MKRLKPETRAAEILAAALQLSHAHGYNRVTRAQIATQVGCVPALITHYYNTMTQLRRAIVGEAIRVSDMRVIAQALCMRDARANNLSLDVKIAAMQFVTGGGAE